MTIDYEKFPLITPCAVEEIEIKSYSRAKNRPSYFWHVKGRVFRTSVEAGEYFNVSKKTIGNWCMGAKKGDKFYPPKENCWAVKR